MGWSSTWQSKANPHDSFYRNSLCYDQPGFLVGLVRCGYRVALLLRSSGPTGYPPVPETKANRYSSPQRFAGARASARI